MPSLPCLPTRAIPTETPPDGDHHEDEEGQHEYPEADAEGDIATENENYRDHLIQTRTRSQTPLSQPTAIFVTCQW